MNRDIHRLAVQYINEVIKDQQRLGYVDPVPVATREAAIEHAETALGELAESTIGRRDTLAA